MSERRRFLTPLESELREPAKPRVRNPSRFQRLRRKKRPPTTTRGAVARGLVRLGIAVGIACGIALLVSHFVGRGTAFGFYVTGAAIFAIAFMTSTGGLGGRTSYYWSSRGEREQRFNWSFAYVLVGALVVAIGVLIDLL